MLSLSEGQVDKKIFLWCCNCALRRPSPLWKAGYECPYSLNSTVFCFIYLYIWGSNVSIGILILLYCSAIFCFTYLWGSYVSIGILILLYCSAIFCFTYLWGSYVSIGILILLYCSVLFNPSYMSVPISSFHMSLFPGRVTCQNFTLTRPKYMFCTYCLWRGT